MRADPLMVTFSVEAGGDLHGDPFLEVPRASCENPPWAAPPHHEDAHHQPAEQRAPLSRRHQSYPTAFPRRTDLPLRREITVRGAQSETRMVGHLDYRLSTLPVDLPITSTMPWQSVCVLCSSVGPCPAFKATRTHPFACRCMPSLNRSHVTLTRWVTH